MDNYTIKVNAYYTYSYLIKNKNYIYLLIPSHFLFQKYIFTFFVVSFNSVNKICKVDKYNYIKWKMSVICTEK